jgi:hypothetical protein
MIETIPRKIRTQSRPMPIAINAKGVSYISPDCQYIFGLGESYLQALLCSPLGPKRPCLCFELDTSEKGF